MLGASCLLFLGTSSPLVASVSFICVIAERHALSDFSLCNLVSYVVSSGSSVPSGTFLSTLVNVVVSSTTTETFDASVPAPK